MPTFDGFEAGAALTGTEIIPMVQGGELCKTTVQNIADLGGGGTPTLTATQIAFGNVSNAMTSDSTLTYITATGKASSPRFEATNTDDSGTPDSAFRINRSLTLSVLQNGHGFRDQTAFSRNGYAYAAFDGAVNVTGTSGDHQVSFQSRITTNNSGTISNLYSGVDVNNIITGRVTNFTSWESEPNVTAGATGADNRYAFRVKDVTGLGSVGNNIGLEIANLTRGTANLSILSGTAPSFFQGKISIGSIGSNSGNVTGMLTVDNIGNITLRPAVFASATAANGLKPIVIRNEGQTNLLFSAFSGNFQPAIQIQSDDNSKVIYLMPNGSTNGAFIRTGASGLDIVVGGTTTNAGTNALAITSAAVISLSSTTGTGTRPVVASSTGVLSAPTILEYADNAAAIIGGLTIGQFYRTGDSLKIVH